MRHYVNAALRRRVTEDGHEQQQARAREGSQVTRPDYMFTREK